MLLLLNAFYILENRRQIFIVHGWRMQFNLIELHSTADSQTTDVPLFDR